MNITNQITYLANNQVDKSAWDRCIDEADNGLIYAYSFYLNHMSRNWDALVLNNYEAVMPLTWNRKFGIYYLYQPFLTASLGVFGKHLDGPMLKSFLQAVPAKFKYWDIYLNHSNMFPLDKFDLQERMNHTLSLRQPYELIYNNYRENIRRNIRKAALSGCSISRHVDVEQIIRLSIDQLQVISKIKNEDFNGFRKLYSQLHNNKQAITCGVVSSRGELISSCVFFFSHKRAYYILVGNHPNGKTLGASHMLIDSFIKEHAGRDLLLDFEGSNVHNIAFFFKSFGAAEEKYPGLRLNRLPPILKWIKS